MVIISLIEVSECTSEKAAMPVATELVEAAISVSVMSSRAGAKSRAVVLLSSKIDGFRKRCIIYQWKEALTIVKKAFNTLKETKNAEEKIGNEIWGI